MLLLACLVWRAGSCEREGSAQRSLRPLPVGLQHVMTALQSSPGAGCHWQLQTRRTEMPYLPSWLHVSEPSVVSAVSGFKLKHVWVAGR